MYDRLLVPIGDDATRDHIGSVAVVLGRTLGVPVELVTVESPGMDTMRAHDELDAMANDLDVPTRQPVVLASNDVAAALTDYVDQHPGALLCTASHGRGRVGTAVLGSVALEVVRLAHRPLIVVGPHAHADLDADGGVVAGIAPDDPNAQPVAAAAASFAHGIGVPVHLLGVGGDPDRLNRLAADVGATCETIGGDHAADQLAAVASRRAAWLTAVGTRAASSVTQLLVGSVAQRVIHLSTAPVLVIPPHC